MQERRFTFENCTVVVHLPKNQDTVRKATEKFIREVLKHEQESIN